MTDRDYASKIAQADRLVNDPDILMDAALVWRLMDEISAADRQRMPERKPVREREAA